MKGVIPTSGQGTRLVEKPAEPRSNLAISSVYFIEDSVALFDALEHRIENDLRGASGEYQLTDVLQQMVERDSTLAKINIESSVIGDNTRVRGRTNELNVGDNSTIKLGQ